jgi:hypothetical protein
MSMGPPKLDYPVVPYIAAEAAYYQWHLYMCDPSPLPYKDLDPARMDAWNQAILAAFACAQQCLNGTHPSCTPRIREDEL